MKKKHKLRILYGLEAADGGALKHLSYLVSNLNQEHFEITVILSDKRSEKASQEISKMRAKGAEILLVPMERRISLFKDLRSFLSIFTHLLKFKYDVVHAHSSKAGVLFRLAAWIQRVPLIIYTPHCFYFQSKTGIRKIFFIWIEKLMGKITDFIVVSNTEKIWAINHNVFNIKKLKNINNAIDFNEYPIFYERENAKQNLGISNNSIVVGAIGRLVVQKDWLTYVYGAKEVLKEFPNVHFLIVGDGDLSVDIKRTISELKLEKRIIVTGHCSTINSIYSVIDIFVSTSLWEGLPYVLLEAMWFKKPIVATNLGYHDIVKDNDNGFLVEVKNYQLLAEKVKELIRNKSMSITMGERGHQLVKSRFSFQKFVKMHEMLYKGK